MNENDVRDKWDAIYRNEPTTHWPVAQVLLDYAYLLPLGGVAIDIACGQGGNAIFLAQRGLTTRAWDISQVAIDQLQQRSEKMQLPIVAEKINIQADSFASLHADVMVVAHYLDRKLIPHLIKSLNNGGLIFYQTFCADKLSTDGPKQLDFLLQTNELLHLFYSLRVLIFRDEGRTGDAQFGFRNKSMIVAQKI